MYEMIGSDMRQFETMKKRAQKLQEQYICYPEIDSNERPTVVFKMLHDFAKDFANTYIRYYVHIIANWKRTDDQLAYLKNDSDAFDRNSRM